MKSKEFIWDNYNSDIKDKGIEQYEQVAIVIPVYNEQNVIEESLLNFIPLILKGIKVYYVTTTKEKTVPTTRDILAQIIEKYGVSKNCYVINYPYEDGVMAHQLNYAIRQIEEDKIVMVYNVDSGISLKTVNYIIDNKDKLKNGVFQQYSYAEYIRKGHLINCAVAWQNRWSLAYELSKAIDAQKKRKWYNFNYVIGHGLIFSKEIYRKFGGVPEEEINEDNVLGYILHLEHLNIYPIPYLEKIDFAWNIKVYIKQQSIWFNGPLYAFNYLKNIVLYRTKLYKLPEMVIVACLNFKNALNWVGLPCISAVSMVILIISKKWLELILLIAGLFLYIDVLNIQCEKFLQETGYLKREGNSSSRVFVFNLIFLLFIHSAGPVLTLYKILMRNNNQKNKYKTEKISKG